MFIKNFNEVGRITIEYIFIYFEKTIKKIVFFLSEEWLFFSKYKHQFSLPSNEKSWEYYNYTSILANISKEDRRKSN